MLSAASWPPCLSAIPPTDSLAETTIAFFVETCGLCSQGMTAMDYCFEWDPNKAAANRCKHGLSFDQATTVFLDPRALSLYDEDHSTAEDRWMTLGISATTGLLVVHHTYEESGSSAVRIRIISVRKATKREARQYTETRL
jgi:uncharacterized protein